MGRRDEDIENLRVLRESAGYTGIEGLKQAYKAHRKEYKRVRRDQRGGAFLEAAGVLNFLTGNFITGAAMIYTGNRLRKRVKEAYA